jgi:predicted signal transduction protein with EAL and GGDEF domain
MAAISWSRPLARSSRFGASGGSGAARVGGDEFAVALTGTAAREAAAGAASAIVHSLDQPFAIRGFEFHVSAAVGYAVSIGTGLTPGEVVRRADVAMYHAKAGAEREAIAITRRWRPAGSRRSGSRPPSAAPSSRASSRSSTSPWCAPPTSRSSASRPSVRWTSREFGPVSPVTFIPVAEETGLIHEIGRIVFDRACRDLLQWPA